MSDYISSRNILYSLSTLRQIRDNFVNELNQASQGKKTSLAFLKNPLPKKSLVKNGQMFQVFVIGGSVFKTAIVKKDKNNISIITSKEEKMPIIQNKKMLFSLLAEHLNSQVSVVAVNFAFSLEPHLRNGVLDGKRRWVVTSKGHQFKELTNKFIGEELEKYIRKQQIKVSVANDTVCLLLSSKTDVAGVVGTGTNFAFFLDKNTAVNLQSGNFNKFPQTETGKEIDKNSSKPGQHLFEKEVSGAYLYQHYNYLARERKAKIPVSVLSFHINSTTELDQLAIKGDSLAQKLFERSASLIACQIAGIYSYQESNFKFQISNFKFLMEGSLFWQGYHYQDYVKKYLKLLTVRENAISFIKINNSDIIGAAQLVIGVLP